MVEIRVFGNRNGVKAVATNKNRNFNFSRVSPVSNVTHVVDLYVSFFHFLRGIFRHDLDAVALVLLL